MSDTTPGTGTAVNVNQNEAFGLKENHEVPYTEGLSSIGRSTIAAMLEYAEAMHPDKPIDSAAAIRYQTGLYRALINNINRNTEDFNKTWGTVLMVFEKYKDEAFSERALFRYMHVITLSDDKRVTFRRLLDLIRVTAPPLGRHLALRQISLARALEFDFTAEGRQRVMNFYQRYMTS